MSEAVDGVIVHHADGLHEGIGDGRTEKCAAAPDQVFAEGVGFGRFCRYRADGFPAVDPGPAGDKTPEIGVETSGLILDFQKHPGVAHRGLDLAPVADDVGISKQLLDPSRIIRGDPLRVEAVERLTVTLAFPQDGDPAQAGLGALQDEKLEQPAVVVQRDPPLGVMVANKQRVSSGPGAADAHMSDP